MTEQEELKFIKQWLASMDALDTDFRQPLNTISIRLTGKYVAIDSSGTVSVAEVEGWKK